MSKQTREEGGKEKEEINQKGILPAPFVIEQVHLSPCLQLRRTMGATSCPKRDNG